ncbi:MAG: adenylate kinase [Candidatus Aenigmatarchaeota archaeon]
MKILVTAVPGGGKSTVLEYVKKKLPEVKVVTAGDIFLEIASRVYGIKNRDDLRKKLTIEQQRIIQENVARRIAKIKAKILLVNTHITIKTPYGYFHALSERTMRIMKPDLIILLEFNPRDVLKRRILDKSRKRDLESLDAIEEHQIVNRNVAFDVASQFECPVKIINLRFKEKKPFEQAIKGAKEIIKLIEVMKK